MATPGAPADSNLENIIKKNFFTEVQQRRVKTELQFLKELDQNCFKVSLQSTPIGLKVLVNLTKNFILEEIKGAEKFVFPIVFEFLLEPKFPFVFPKLFCKTNFFTPSLADGRDFVGDVIQRLWNPSILLRDIVLFIPNFLKSLIQLSIPEESQLYGHYYLGHLYNLEDFLTMDTAHVFPGSEMINEQSVNNERYFIVIESYFLNFESVDKAKNTLRLIGWAHVQAIARIKRNRNDGKMLVFLWHDSAKKGVLVQNVFILDQSEQLVSTIARMGQKYATITESIKKQRDLPLAEVTAKNYRDMNIDELLENIVVLESKLESEQTIDVINLLMNLYQKAVEYFSALNDPAYAEFVEKLHDLLTREDIQAILKSSEVLSEGVNQPGVKVTKARQTKEKIKESKQEDNTNARPEIVLDNNMKVIEERKEHEPKEKPKKQALHRNIDDESPEHSNHIDKIKNETIQEQVPKEEEQSQPKHEENNINSQSPQKKDEVALEKQQEVSKEAENKVEEEKSSQEHAHHQHKVDTPEPDKAEEISHSHPQAQAQAQTQNEDISAKTHAEEHQKKEEAHQLKEAANDEKKEDQAQTMDTFIPPTNDDMFDIGDDDD